MSIELIKSPIYPFPFSPPDPPPGYTVDSVALISQVFWAMQRDDMDGTGYTVQDNGGFLQINFGIVFGSPNIGENLFIEQDKTFPGGPIPLYQGTHKIQGIVLPGSQFLTTTPWISSNNDGFLTSQHNDVLTLTAEIDIETGAINDFTQDYKIPYNKPLFNLDLGESMRPTFALLDSEYFRAAITLTAQVLSGALTGSALTKYDLQLFECELVQGSLYGANLNWFVLRTLAPGKILTLFEQPKFYREKITGVSYYVDEDFTGAPWTLSGVWLDINKDVIGGPAVEKIINFDGFGIKHEQFDLGVAPANAKFIDVWIADSGDTPISQFKIYEYDSFCQGEIMVAWLNRLGGAETYAFNIWNESVIESHQGLKYEKGGVFDLADNVNREVVVLGDANQIYTLTAKGLSRLDLAAITEILRSPRVEILTYDTVNSQFTRLQVSMIDGFNTTYQFGQKKVHDFTCRIKLPVESRLLENLVTYPI